MTDEGPDRSAMYERIMEALDEGERWQVFGQCKHFWRKKHQIIIELGGMSNRFVKLPTTGDFCEPCIQRIEDGDPKMIAGVTPNPKTGMWTIRNLYTKEVIGELPPSGR